MAEVRQQPVTAYLTVKGGLKALDLYRRAFGGKLLTRKMANDGKRVLHAALDISGTMVMLSDEFPEYAPEIKSPRTLKGTSVHMHFDFDKPAKVDAAIRKAQRAGCKVVLPVADTFWGMRYGRVRDPFGHIWAFGAALRAPSKTKR